VKVLYITADPVASPEWLAADGQEVELIRAPTVAEAVLRLSRERVDAVALDPRVLAGRDDGDRALGAAAEAVVADPGTLAEALARSEARFRDVIERNADAIVVVDREGVIQFANAMAGEVFDCAPDALVGTPFGYPLTVGESTEVDLVRKGVPTAVVELRVVESEWEGRQASIVSLRDITERKRSEERERRLIREQTARATAELAARRFRFLAEAATVLSSSLEYEKTLTALARLCVSQIADWALVYILEEGGELHRLAVAHRDPEKVELVRELRDLPIRPGGPHPVLPVLQTGDPVLVRRVTDRDLERLAEGPRHLQLLHELGVASYMLVPLMARGRSLGAIGLVCADPTRAFGDQDLALAENLASRAALAVDNARLYREAQEATRAKTDLMAVISHDLRTPLNSIIGYAELLIMGVPEPLSPGTRERVERMRSGAQHLLHLINQLLTLSRLDAGREELRPEDVDVAELVRDVAMLVEPLAQERKLRFQLDLPEAPVAVRTDPGKLRQVLMNLAANAIKFTDEGEVRVSVHQGDAAGTMIQVADTGPGIAPEHQERIFEPFWQVRSSERSRTDGTGLGLSVVRKLVELLGGEITVESQVGRGTTFSVQLPEAARGPPG
jgi:signal transduction histidine kinase/PAS domain-containing protein